jgi:hypothetical protein
MATLDDKPRSLPGLREAKAFVIALIAAIYAPAFIFFVHAPRPVVLAAVYVLVTGLGLFAALAFRLMITGRRRFPPTPSPRGLHSLPAVRDLTLSQRFCTRPICATRQILMPASFLTAGIQFHSCSCMAQFVKVCLRSAAFSCGAACCRTVPQLLTRFETPPGAFPDS